MNKYQSDRAVRRCCPGTSNRRKRNPTRDHVTATTAKTFPIDFHDETHLDRPERYFGSVIRLLVEPAVTIARSTSSFQNVSLWRPNVWTRTWYALNRHRRRNGLPQEKNKLDCEKTTDCGLETRKFSSKTHCDVGKMITRDNSDNGEDVRPLTMFLRCYELNFLFCRICF